jgi:hypothetical protein
MVEGLCFNCLSSSHRVDSCKTPTKCWRCRHSGHTSFSCPATHRIVPALNKRHRLGLIARPAPSRKIIRQLPPPSAMAHFDLSGRSDFDICNLPFTEEIRDRIKFFEAHSLIVWIGKNRLQTDPEHVVEAFMFRFGLDRSCIQVSRHHPADFLVSILDRDVFEELAGRVSFSYGGQQFHLRR